MRLLRLDRIPTGITADELDYVFTAKSLYLSGKDLSDTRSLFSLAPASYETPKAELPYLLLVPFIGPFPFSLFYARVPFVIANTLLILAIYLITKKFIGPRAGHIAGILAAINPWFIFFGRTSFDAPLAVMFLYWGIYVLMINNSWRILWSFPLFAIAFFSYIGIKVVFLPFTLTTIFFSYMFKRRYHIQHAALALICVSLVGYYVATLGNNPGGSRVGELFTPNDPMIAARVETERRATIDTPLEKLFNNKVVLYGRFIFEKWLNFFSPQYLFLSGDARSTFSVYQYGVLHYVDIFFVPFGLIILIYKKRKFGIYLASLLFLAPLPAAVSNVGITYSIRAALAFPLFIILAASGIDSTLSAVKKVSYKKILAGVIILLYSINLLQFSYIYFTKDPVANSESFALSDRVLSRYLHFANEIGKPVLVLSEAPFGVIRNYLFYGDKLNDVTLPNIAASVQNEVFELAGVRAVRCKDLSVFPVEKDITVIATPGGFCGKEILEDHLSIPLLSDGGEVYWIYRDFVCDGYELKLYPYDVSLGSFEIEKLSREQFCTTFITNLSPIYAQ